MATIRSIKKRIKSAKNISQITKAMQMVSASKMRKAQDAAVSAKPYQEKIFEAVETLSAGVNRDMHDLLAEGNEKGKTLVVLISTNKGLCGGLNTTLFRQVTKWFDRTNDIDYVSLGKKSQHYCVRSKQNLIAHFANDDFLEVAQPVTELFTQNFINGTYKEVYIVYNQFINSLSQKPARTRVLPIEIAHEKKEIDTTGEGTLDDGLLEFLIEPSPARVLDALLPHYVEVQVRAAILEAAASEHSARMIAMKNATDNAKSLIGDLTLAYNRLRQERITYEISDMVTARLSVE